MEGLKGINHVALLTSDMDRLVDFYQELFGARKLMELPIPDLNGRHGFIDIGGGAVLHAFEIPGVARQSPAPEMFKRGRLDHFALAAGDASAFEELRRCLVARRCSDGVVTDFGVVRVFNFTDPDGFEAEVALWLDDRDPGEIDMSRATDENLSQRGRAYPTR